MIRSIIIDDEPNCIEVLEMDIKVHCPEVQVVERCTSAKEGIIAIRKHNPGLVFLDVEMPWMNGFEMLEIMGEVNFNIVFTTAYDHFASRAFRVSAVDYLLKPIDPEDLISAIEKVKLLSAKTNNQNTVTNLLQNTKLPEAQQRIALPRKDGYDFVPVCDIIYCKAEGAYAHVFLTNNRKFLLSMPLAQISTLLPDTLFERIHNSLLVNITHIAQFKKNEGNLVVMQNGDRLSVAKSRKNDLLKRMGIL